MTAWGGAAPAVDAPSAGAPRAAFAAAAVTIPHALGLGLLAYAPLMGQLPVAALALWSAALPGAVVALATGRRTIIYAPTTVVALLYAAVLALVTGSAAKLGLTPPQQLAACAATAALGMGFQWLLGAFRLASLARFLPISVMHGFAAGVGLSMLVGQVRNGFGAGGLHAEPRVLLHAIAALAVVALARISARRWPRWPGLLTGAAAVTFAIAVSGFGGDFTPAAVDSPFALPPLPDFAGVPWLAVTREHGTQLVTLALLMALVNSLEILVFNQELELEHGLRIEPNASLRRESLVGVACALTGLIPASTSASRTRIAIAQAGPAAPAGPIHAAILLAVAASGPWWLHWVPMAALSGALVLAGLTQVPAAMWSRAYLKAAPASWAQSWMVGLIFPLAGGVGALVAGLVVATFVLLRASAGSALRHAHLDGQVRSRRMRRAASESWLAPRMNRIAVVELQGVMSFGVAAYLAERVRLLLQPRHDRVLLDAQRVAAWDTTALMQLRALARDYAQQGRQLAVCGLDARSRAQLAGSVLQFADLDHGLEWAEDALLEERPAAERPAYPVDDALGEVGEGMAGAGREALETLLVKQEVAPCECLFLAGERQRDLYVVQAGLVTMSTAWPPADGIRLVKVGQGMPFGEMAFLNGEPRTACAGAEQGPARVVRLRRQDFDAWAQQHPQDAFVLLSNLALVGTRRLAATTRQLRAVLE